MNIAIDTSSENRLSATTNELYISEPYFTHSEAAAIRSATLDNLATLSNISDFSDRSGNPTIEEAIHHRLSDFLDKRKASGDARPCGPHDMVPIYSEVLGISKEEIKDERFLSRLRRSGIGDVCAKDECAVKEEGGGSGKRRQQKGKKDKKNTGK